MNRQYVDGYATMFSLMRDLPEHDRAIYASQRARDRQDFSTYPYGRGSQSAARQYLKSGKVEERTW